MTIKRQNAVELRRQTFERDQGICAICDVDCEQLKAEYWPRLPVVEIKQPTGYQTDEQALEAVIAMQHSLANLLLWCSSFEREILFRGYLRKEHPWITDLGRGDAFWQMDHLIPLVENGADDISNCRTLCIQCHRDVTKDLAGRRARKPSKTYNVFDKR